MSLTHEQLHNIDAYWRAANYLAAGQLYLLDNPLLRRPLTRADVKKKIVGHWGTVPGQNFVYVHLNRIVKKYDQDLILISGPGHGGNFFVANAYLDGTYSEVYPNISRDEEGMKKLFKQFSFPGGISSHVAPETPGSINEGGELGYSIAHAFGAVFDNPGLIAAVTVGDGEAETGPLAQLEAWLRSYRPEELFDENGTLRPELQALAPTGDRRIAANPHANGGKLLRDLRTPDFRKYAVDIPYPGSVEKQDMIELKVRVVNVVDLMKLEPSAKHPHGLTDADYDALFTRDKPIIFAFHGYQTLIHELTYERANRNLSVHGYQEEGTITTPFDMREQNEIDRFHLVKDAVQHLPQLGNRGGYLIQQMNDKLVEHKNYIHEVGQDLPEILDWK